MPLTFLSYTHADNQWEREAITKFRKGLSNAFTIVVASPPLEIFQDRDIEWGKHWPKELRKAINRATFLIPIITPGFFDSTSCRDEVTQFLEIERRLGRDDLILPVYWRTTDKMDDPEQRQADKLASILHHRQWRDWRKLRTSRFDSPAVKKMLEAMAEDIARAFRRPNPDLGSEDAGSLAGLSIDEPLPFPSSPALRPEPPLQAPGPAPPPTLPDSDEDAPRGVEGTQNAPRGNAQGIGAQRPEPGLADRPGQPADGLVSESRRGLATSLRRYKDIFTSRYALVLFFTISVPVMLLFFSPSAFFMRITSITDRAFPGLFNPPPVSDKEITLKYHGNIKRSDSFYYSTDDGLLQRFTSDTSIKVTHDTPKDGEPDVTYEDVRKLLDSKSVDVVSIDLVWVKDLSDRLVDLKPYFTNDILEQYDPKMINNNTTTDGRLVALPWFEDIGVLFYNKTLLQDGGPPSTWDVLNSQVKTFSNGQSENAVGFIGFIWEAQASEALTCSALEWIASWGAVDQDNKISLSSPNAHKAVSYFRELVKQGGGRLMRLNRPDLIPKLVDRESMFLRKWSSDYQYILSKDKSNDIHVSAIPSATNSHFGVAGGWQLAVARSSSNLQASIKLVKYLASEPVQKWRALRAGYVPAILKLTKDDEIMKKMPLLYETIPGIRRIMRSSKGKEYAEASSCFNKEIHNILDSTDDAEYAKHEEIMNGCGLTAEVVDSIDKSVKDQR